MRCRARLWAYVHLISPDGCAWIACMFAEPTINDFLDNIRWHLKKAANNARLAVDAVQARLSANGALQSGRAIVMTFDAVRKEFDAGMDAVLGELKRTIFRTGLDRAALRQAALQCLQN